jgi:multidrug efflux system membrane fusion protein
MKKILINSMIVGLALSLSACEKPVEEVAGPRPALVMTVQSEGAKSTMAIVGEIKARYESVQGFRVGGKVIKR